MVNMAYPMSFQNFEVSEIEHDALFSAHVVIIFDTSVSMCYSVIRNFRKIGCPGLNWFVCVKQNVSGLNEFSLG